MFQVPGLICLLLCILTSSPVSKHINKRVEGDRGREPGRIGAGGGREAGGDRAGCGSHVRAGGGRTMRDIKFFNDFLVPF